MTAGDREEPTSDMRATQATPAARGLGWQNRTVRTGVAAGVLALGVLGFACCAVLVETGWAPLLRLDRGVVEAMAGVATDPGPWRDAFVVVGVVFFPWTFRVLGVAVAAVLFRHGERRLALWLAGTVVAGSLLGWGLKPLIGRARPQVPGAVTADGFAFPSGHALVSALVVGALLLLLLRYDPSRGVRAPAWAGAVLLVVLVGFDRLALDVHHLSDVLAGWFVALALLGGAMLGYGGLGRSTRSRHGRDHRVAVIINPVKVEDHAGFRRRLDRRAQASGWPAPVWYETTRDDAGHAMAQAALAEGVDLVIAAGGDGTVRVVCAELASTGTAVGIVPAGTGNLLARNLGLPLDHGAAIRVAFEGVDRLVDLVRVSGDGLEPDRFAVMAGLGLDAAIVGEADARLKTRMGWPAYLVSAAKNFSFPAISVEITVDDEPPVRRRARTVLLGNVGTLAGGVPLLPEARPDDGLLDVVVLAPRAVSDWPRLAWRVARRSPARDERLTRWRGRRVVVRAADPCPRQLDGDVIAPGRELRAEIEHEALTVRVPYSVGPAASPPRELPSPGTSLRDR